MAKSNHRQVDKLERKQRLDGIRRSREIEDSEFRNMNRLGWREFNDEEDEEDECEDVAA